MIVDHQLEAPGIAIVRSSRAWARTLHRYVVDHGGAIVKTRPLEERQVIEDDYDVLIVDDISSFLNNHIVDEVHRTGRRVLGVYDLSETVAGDDTGRQRLLRVGVDGVIEASLPPEEFVRAIQDLAPSPSERTQNSGQYENDFEFGYDQLGQQVDAAMPHVPSYQSPDPRRLQPRRRGHVTAVLGASGGCGVTEIAIELGRSLGKRGEKTVIVDADEMAPSLAQRLNLSLHPNIRTAVDVVEHSSGRLAECLTGIASNLEILAGIPHPRDWIEVRGSDMTAVLDEIARGRPQVVVNCSPSIEDLAGFGGADRFAMTRAAVVSADLIIVVCPPSPMGVARLIDRVADLAMLAEGKPIHVVINRTQKGVFKRNEMAREIQRNFAPAGIHFVPSDPKVEVAAWEGTLAARGEFTKAIATTIAPMVPKAAMLNAAGRGRPPRPGGPRR